MILCEKMIGKSLISGVFDKASNQHVQEFIRVICNSALFVDVENSSSDSGFLREQWHRLRTHIHTENMKLKRTSSLNLTRHIYCTVEKFPY